MNVAGALYGGLDLHGDNVFCSLLDSERQVVFEKRLPNDLVTIREALEPFRQRIGELAVESTYNWYWLVDGLRALKYRVKLANPALMQENLGLKAANDKTDARFLARQLVNGILPVRYSPEMRAWFQRKQARSGKRVIAVKALACKVAKACFFMMRDKKDFDVKKLVG